MRYKRTTQVPNETFDTYLPVLTGAELKVLLIIIRQTYGWIYRNGKRKERDRINYSQFVTKTNLSRRAVADAIQSLVNKELIHITDYYKNILHTPELRKGKVGIYYTPCFDTYAETEQEVGKNSNNDVQKLSYNKTNNTKLKRQKDVKHQGNKKLSDKERIQQILSL